ncbi:PAS domain-containing sensor histidine kinase [Halogeometricum sp. S1BR25-6]|uniref:histidine kinase n=1 Tax=Halogeometricum salsisoli TaxID=2950536 RepID=A0ABU2GE56_9EURY|nr:ATP-binding protein [Halogeometricum sp. S1BR25-6]MDS0298558.1 PAS domain-containing sensor histidine kinase [Halogeometricum sp. S1BR25-6]
MDQLDNLGRAGIDALPVEAAIVDAEGTILLVNEPWRGFADENRGERPDYWVGENYFDVCERAGGSVCDGVVAGLRAVLDGSRERFRFEYPCHGPSEQRWSALDAVRFRHGTDHYLLLCHFDVTEQKRNESLAEARSEQLETLLGILTHDVRNPLNVIEGYAELLATESDGDSAELDAIRRAAARITEITETALEFARTGATARIEPLSVGEVAAEAWDNVATGDATLEARPLPRVHGDRRLLSHLFENLFRNAVEHGDADCAVTVGPLLDGFYVEDDGSGLPGEIREKARRADFSTQGAGGLGLAIVQSVARLHGGTLRITDACGGGARFEVTGFDIAPGDPAPDAAGASE